MNKKNIQSWILQPDDLQQIAYALREDLLFPWQDLTCQSLFANHNYRGSAEIISKDPNPVVICGLNVLSAIFQQIDPSCQITTFCQDGDTVQPRTQIATITGSATSLLMAERTVLNYLRHLSAIATVTAQFVDKVKHTSLKILDTRKTTPGLRHLEKYAVACGGGVNHRMGLYDAIMVKDTHIDLLGTIRDVLKKLPELTPDSYPVIIEVQTIAELEIILAEGLTKVNRVLLDNMNPEQLTICANLCKGKLATEASGNLNLENITAVANTGVDYASVGMLTHSAGHVDLSMKTKKVNP